MTPDLLTARVPMDLARSWAFGCLTDAAMVLAERPHHPALVVLHLGGGASGVRLLRRELARLPISAMVFRAAHGWGLARGCQRMCDEGGGWYRYWAGPLQLSRWILTRPKQTPSPG